MSRYKLGGTKYPDPPTPYEGFKNIAKYVIITAVLDMVNNTPYDFTSAKWVLKNPYFDFWITLAEFTEYEDHITDLARGVIHEKNQFR